MGLLGFESDAMGMKLICHKKPSLKVIDRAINVINVYQQRMKQSNPAMGMMPMPSVTQGGGVGFENNENKNDILSLEQIILWATHENMQNNDTMETLIMTHKMFTDSLTLLKH